MEEECSLMNTACSDVVILCGGSGTRLKTVLRDRPKPMAPIHGRPFLDLVVNHVISHGFRRIIFCTGYRGEWIAQHFSPRIDIDAIMSHEEIPIGTAGALRACRHALRSSTVLVLNGDSLCAIDLAAFITEHRRRNASATVAVVPADDRSDGGGITLDSQHRITSFDEKTRGMYLNAGIYALESMFLDQIPERTPCSLEHDMFPALLGQGIHAIITQTPVHDIGTPARLDAFRTWMTTSVEKHIEKGAAC
ncbi:MAG: galactokinase [Nitrospira sp.]|nr:MAG: galactokinase [Nitrospira sp.]